MGVVIQIRPASLRHEYAKAYQAGGTHSSVISALVYGVRVLNVLPIKIIYVFCSRVELLLGSPKLRAQES